MSSGAIAFCAIIIVFVGLLLIAELAERSDTYKGVRNFGCIVRGEMQMRWLHGECMTGHGAFCSSCRKYNECHKQCEEHMFRVIDAEQENDTEVKK